MANYSYPIDMDWTHEEMNSVIKFLNMVELAYEKGVPAAKVMEAYKAYKKVVPSIAEEKTMCKQFERESGYSLYRVVKAAKENPTKIIRMA
ncbi:Uncharacterized protein YktA, UPF0223 family [Granulicatella balaenopterae]|uniref:Uncharacterized protein YktA, UPF0223 family n=1 Tax=Granulicatella balaenopterae TaxID=137733 RepID=A0A1H9JYZ1_9LACT|nr:UPF0223 family protein [Granulicatella balaenopterae]SEQ92020.1 Uncharacterized protein YktA, UPF0223 family [Granulicatella balaenopterae]